MQELELKSTIHVCQMEELTADEQHLIELAIEATSRSYAPYSHFHVGAAVRLANGVELSGSNQENAAYPSGLCAERSAMIWAGANYPDIPMDTLAIAGSDHGVLCESPASPCGACRQVMAEYQKKHNRPLKIILVGSKRIRKFGCVDDLLPFIFDSLSM
jgi:cytidine deaminase